MLPMCLVLLGWLVQSQFKNLYSLFFLPVDSFPIELGSVKLVNGPSINTQNYQPHLTLVPTSQKTEKTVLLLVPYKSMER